MPATVMRKRGDFSSLGLGSILPVTEGMAGAFFPGGNAQLSRKNHVPGKPDATVVGPVEFFEGYIRCKGNVSFLDLDIAETEAMTIGIAWRSVNAAAPSYRFPLSNIGPTSTVPVDHGFGLRGQPGTPQVGAVVGANNGGTVYLAARYAPMAPTGWQYHIARIPRGLDDIEIINATTGERTVQSVTNGSVRQINSQLPFRLGSSHYVGDVAEVEIGPTFLAHRWLPDTEWRLLYGQAKARFARLSSPIAI